MFDVGFSELLLVALVALLVLGPERLPRAARFVGLWVRRARAQWHSVKAELERDLAAEELQRSLREGREELRRAGDELRAVERDATGRGTTGRDDAARGDGERPDDRG